MEATITEAVSDKKDETTKTSAKKEDIIKIMTNKNFKNVETENLNRCTSSSTEEADSVIYFSTFDKNDNNKVIHKNYCSKLRVTGF